MIITAGKFKGQKINVPDESITRPTLSKVRMSVFNTLQAMIDFENSTFLDMYAGSGIMGLEALSRGFSKATAIEKNPKAANIIKNNLLTDFDNFWTFDILKNEFEAMDPYQVYEYVDYEEANKSIIFLNSNQMNRLTNQEIIDTMMQVI